MRQGTSGFKTGQKNSKTQNNAEKCISLGSNAEESMLLCVKCLSACQRHLWDVGSLQLAQTAVRMVRGEMAPTGQRLQ